MILLFLSWYVSQGYIGFPGGFHRARYGTHLTLAEADGTVSEDAGVVGLPLDEAAAGRHDHLPAALAVHHPGLELILSQHNNRWGFFFFTRGGAQFDWLGTFSKAIMRHFISAL